MGVKVSGHGTQNVIRNEPQNKYNVTLIIKPFLWGVQINYK